jgi:hypothetical protein
VVTGTSNGCTASVSQLVTVNAAPSVTVSGTTSICSGASTTLTANGANTYSWSGGPATASYSVTPATSTTYLVTGTSNGCTASVSQLVTVSSPPTIPVISESASVLTSTLALTYQWYLNGTPISGASAQSYTPVVSGVYSVAVTDSNGCAAMSTDFQFTISGLTKTQLNDVIEIAPNPGNGLFYIKMQTDEFISLRVTDSKGALILMSDTFSNTIDLSDQTPGLYHCRIINSKGTLVKKLVLTDGME